MDKKSCENCKFLGKRTGECFRCESSLREWKRHPHMWLSILPEEPGWYWWIPKEAKVSSIVYIYNDSSDKDYPILKLECQCGVDEDISQLNGQWQGPIRPEGE